MCCFVGLQVDSWRRFQEDLLLCWLRDAAQEVQWQSQDSFAQHRARTEGRENERGS